VGAMAGLRPKTPEVRRPPATPMISREIRERGGLYAGAAGGGKSHPMRVAAIMWCCTIHDLQASRDGLHGRLWGAAGEVMEVSSSSFAGARARCAAIATRARRSADRMKRRELIAPFGGAASACALPS